MFSAATLARMNNPTHFMADGEVYCREHMVFEGDYEPIHEYSHGEWEYYPRCTVCGSPCEDVNLTREGLRLEHPDQFTEDVLHDYEYGHKVSGQDLIFARENAAPERLIEAEQERREFVDDTPPAVAAGEIATEAFKHRQSHPLMFQAALDNLAARRKDK